ncbi:MutS-related protein [Haloimpatiens sp. FM7315]|uniref:MutS-related protein n=1 Tax=Haloimpatiens sp. FM7315 TaxID=3298609 RepID=UPI003709CA53
MKINNDGKESMMLVYGLIFLGIWTGYYSALKIYEGNKLYSIGIVVSIIFFIVAFRLYMKIKDIKVIKYLKDSWGKEIKKKRDFTKIRKLYDDLKKDDVFYVDDQTWFDLNMDNIYSKLDRNLTTPGEQFLYYMLRKPCFSEDKLKKRGENINYLKDNNEVREKIQYNLHKLGKDKNAYLLDFLKDKLPNSKSIKLSLNILLIMSISTIVYAIYLKKPVAMFYIMVMYFINYYVHSKVKKNILGDTSCIKYMYKVLICADSIISIKDLQKNIDEVNIIKKELQPCRKLMKKAVSLIMSNTDGVDILMEYFNIFFLMETRAFFSTVKEIDDNRENIKKIYVYLGKIDALLSIASYRNDIKSYVEPKFLENSKKLVLKKVIHPLVEKPVDNTIIVDRNVIITGSNMSGKSTFLRTLGINVLFAQTIYTCLCDEYEGDYFRIMTSISVSDSVTGGKSYYMGEAEAIYRIINSTKEVDYPIISFIDEIFRGTNPVERINAAAEILKYLAENNCRVFVATHDLELTNMVKEYYDNYYFTENVTKEGLNFDYKIKKGVTSTRNAVKILEYIGYPKEIVENINNRIGKI